MSRLTGVRTAEASRQIRLAISTAVLSVLAVAAGYLGIAIAISLVQTNRDAGTVAASVAYVLGISVVPTVTGRYLARSRGWTWLQAVRLAVAVSLLANLVFLRSQLRCCRCDGSNFDSTFVDNGTRTKDPQLMSNRLDDIWVPRIGAAATSELRRSAYVTMAAVPAALSMSLAASFAFAEGSLTGVLLGCAALLVAASVFAMIVRSRIRLADAMSQWYGTEISHRELPRLRTKQFDEWCESRNLRPLDPRL